MHTASFTIPCVDEGAAKVMIAAVQVEADEGPDGTTTTLSQDGVVVRVFIEGMDLSGLRAAIHGVLRLLDTARRISG